MIRLSKQTHHWELDISCSQVEANLYSFVYATVAMNCSEEVWNSIFQEYTQESLQSKQRYLMKALASTFDVDIIKKLLTYTMGRSIEQLTNIDTGLLYRIYLPTGVPALGWTQAAMPTAMKHQYSNQQIYGILWNFTNSNVWHLTTGPLKILDFWPNLRFLEGPVTPGRYVSTICTSNTCAPWIGNSSKNPTSIQMVP